MISFPVYLMQTECKIKKNTKFITKETNDMDKEDDQTILTAKWNITF